MNKSPDNPTPVNGAGEGQGMEHQPSAWQPETLHELARAYFGNDFPNPDRLACPDRASLLAAAQTGGLPADTLRAHLFGCSACFTEYQTALAARHALVPAIAGPATPSFWLAWPAKVRAAFTIHPGLAWATVAALFLTFGLFTWTRWRNNTRPAVNTPTLTQTQTPANPPPPALAESPAPAPPHSTTLASTIVGIDLNEYVALRDAAEAGSQGKPALKLTPVPTQFRLRLPEGSLAGAYTVRLLDERDQPVVTTNATSRDGQRLNATLDLQGVAAQRYRLEVQHPGAPPVLCPVRVSARNN